MPFDDSSCKYTKEYLMATEEELAKQTTMEGFFYAMSMRYQGSIINFLSNEMNAAVFKGGRYWNWREEE
jgi:hypothetical protein